VTFHPQRDEAEEQRNDRGDREADRQREPRRRAMVNREVGRGIGAQPDERGLAERGLPCDARQQHEAERHHAVQPDVVGERDPERRRRERNRDEQREEHEEGDARPVRHGVVTLLLRDGA
jgi:hypothetical protein